MPLIQSFVRTDHNAHLLHQLNDFTYIFLIFIFFAICYSGMDHNFDIARHILQCCQLFTLIL